MDSDQSAPYRPFHRDSAAFRAISAQRSVVNFIVLPSPLRPTRPNPAPDLNGVEWWTYERETNLARPLDHPRPDAPRQHDHGFGAITTQKERIRIAQPTLQCREPCAVATCFDLADEGRRVGPEAIDVDIEPVPLIRASAAERHPLGFAAEPNMQRHEFACAAGALSRLSRLHPCALAGAAIP
jgi:hypothetical protein